VASFSRGVKRGGRVNEGVSAGRAGLLMGEGRREIAREQTQRKSQTKKIIYLKEERKSGEPGGVGRGREGNTVKRGTRTASNGRVYLRYDRGRCRGKEEDRRR